MNVAAPRCDRVRAFTLIEVLVAVGLTVMVLAVMMGIVVQVSQLSTRTGGRLAAQAQARVVLDELEADLSCLCRRRDLNVWLAALLQPDIVGEGPTFMVDERWQAAPGGATKPPGTTGSLRLGEEAVEACRFGQAGMWVRLIATRAVGPAAPPLPQAVSYQIVRRAVGDRAEYQLFRAEVSAAATFAAGYDLGASGPYSMPDDAPDAPGNLRTPAVDALLARDVVDFGLRLFGNDENGGRLLFPRATGGAEFAARGREEMPSVAELFVRVLTAEGAEHLARWEAGDALAPSGDWWSLVEAHSIVVTRRVELPPPAP